MGQNCIANRYLATYNRVHVFPPEFTQFEKL